MPKTKAPAAEAENYSLQTTMLSYSRSLEVSNALLRVHMQDETVAPLEVISRGALGQIGNPISAEKAEKALARSLKSKDGEAEEKLNIPGYPNPLEQDVCIMPENSVALEVAFDVRVLNFVCAPHSSDSKDVFKNYVELAKRYGEIGGFRYLAERYLWNIANARFVWRNRFMTDDASVTLEFSGGKIIFDPFLLDLDVYPGIGALHDACEDGGELIEELLNRMEKAFTGRPLRVGVRYLADMQPGQMVYPSEKMPTSDTSKDESRRRRFASLRTYSKLERRVIHQALITDKKINAALRTIDEWHGQEGHGAISVNAYGGVLSSRDILRMPGTGRAFFDIQSKGSELMKELADASGPDDLEGNTHFFFAKLIRGGVIGTKGE